MMRTLSAGTLAAVSLLSSGCGQGSDPSVIVASGHVEATDVRISTKVSGRLEAFAIQEGDRITLGQELARLDTTDPRLALRQAKADRDQAAAELRLRLAGARKEDIAELEAQAANVASDLDGAQKDLDRMQGLLDRGSGTTKARDDAKVRRDMAAHRLEAARESLARMKAGSRAEEIDAARARMAATEARVAQLEQQIQDGVVASPVSGVVTEKIAEQGELLQVGSGLCVITDLADAWLTVYISETDMGRIRIGQDAVVRTDEKEPQTRTGKVTFIASKAEFTPKNVQTRDERVKLVFRVKIGLDNRDGLFKPGMPAEARLQAATASR
ncbi:MAG: HlyD family secretion protein [Vicinamibacteria bacterium]